MTTCFVISFDHQLWKFTGSLYNPLWLDRSYLPNTRSQETPRRKCQPDVPLDKRQWLLHAKTVGFLYFSNDLEFQTGLETLWTAANMLGDCLWAPFLISGRMDSASTGLAVLPSPLLHGNQNQWQCVLSQEYKEFVFCTVINTIAGRF